MSLRSAFKAKFQSEKSKSEDTVVVDKDESKDTLSTEEQASASSNDSVLDTSTISQELYLSKLAELTDSLNDDGTHKDWTTSEREIYESQLSNLQEQLVASMIENQSLSEDLKKYKDTTEMDRLQQELEYEREKNKLLIEKFDQLERKPSSSGRVGLNELAEGRRPEDDVDSGIEIAADALHLPAPAEVEKVLTHKAKQYKILAWLVAMYYDFASDFTEDDEEEEMPQDKEGDPLTVKKLKENIKRFKTCTKPIVNFVKVVFVILSWKAPTASLLYFSVYMYAVWHGWLASVLLFSLLYWLTVNYLTTKGWHVTLNILPYSYVEEDNDSDKALGMSDKFQLVLQVARKVQNILGQIADGLEKVRNLVMWQHAEATYKLYVALGVAFIASCFLPGTVLFTIIGLLLGIKFFIVNNIYRKFPKVQQRYDTVFKIWKNLPTDDVLIKRMRMAEREQYILPSSTPTVEEAPVTPSPVTASVLSNENQAFCQLFALPSSEAPLPDWQGGKRCTLISKEKPLTGAFKNGKLFLTRSFLCFERSKNPTPKNLVIPLTDITSCEKAKPYGFLPGGGMAIEINVVGSTQSCYLFGAMINRDESFESIMRAARQACLAWAVEETDTT